MRAMSRLAAAAGAVLALLPAAAFAAAGAQPSALLVFLLINIRHVLYALALCGLFALVQEFSCRHSGVRRLWESAGALVLGWVLVFSSPIAVDVSWLRLAPLFAALCVAGAALAAFRPRARAVFPAFAAMAIAAGFLSLARTGAPLPLLVAEIAGLFSLLLWSVSFAFEKKLALEEKPAGSKNAAEKEKSAKQEKPVALEPDPAQLAAVREEASRAAVARERARYIQDMHDGLGAELVSTLAAVKNGRLTNEQLTQALQSCLDQMRLSIDASGVATEDLAVALANLRYRMEPRLKAAGIALRWNILELADELALPPEKALCALRVVQEALTNALKYSGATEIELRAASDAQHLSLSVTDNGRGMAADAESNHAQGNGLGLAGMRKRVQEAGGTVTVQPGEDGTGVSVRLELPL